jgi:hypothetical protein
MFFKSIIKKIKKNEQSEKKLMPRVQQIEDFCDLLLS